MNGCLLQKNAPRLRRLHLLLVCWAGCCCPLMGQQIRFDHLTAEQGLSQQSVPGILQDHEGFMWFATREGLNKYDGYTFRIYENDPSDSTTLQFNHARVLFEDRDRVLWAAGGGLHRFDRRTERFTAYQHNPDDSTSLSEDNISSVCQDREGFLWLGTVNGLNRFDPKTGKFVRYWHQPGNPNSLGNNLIHALHLDGKGMLWIGTKGGLDAFNPATGAFTHYSTGTNPTDGKPYEVLSLHEDLTGALWMGTWKGGLLQFDKQTGTCKAYRHQPGNPNSLSDNTVTAIREDRQGGLWVGTMQGGLNVLNRKTGQFTRYLPEPANPQSLAGEYVLSIYEDRTGAIWIGTFTGGVNVYDRQKTKFTRYSGQACARSCLTDNQVHALYEDEQGMVWIGNRGGLEKLDRKTGQFTRYTYTDYGADTTRENTTYMIKGDRSGKLWLATQGSGLGEFDPETETFVWHRQDTANPHHISSDFLTAVLEDRSGTLWITTGNGLNAYDRKTRKFTCYLPEAAYFSPDGKYGISNLYEGPSGTLWLATSRRGLASFDRTTKRFIHYPYTPGKPHHPHRSNVIIIHEDTKKRLWVSFSGSVLHRFNPARNTFTPVTAKDGLPTNTIRGILEDKHGKLWLSTRKGGLYHYHPEQKTSRHYDFRDGLQSNEFNGAFFRHSSGEMLFGGNMGFNIFHPDSLADNPHAPPVRLTGFKLFDQPRPLPADTVRLSYRDNFFSFEFVALSYTFPEKNQYAYQLVGVDKQWVQAGNRRYASYTNVPPGHYTFRVKAANHDGVWNRQGAAIAVLVEPPFWATWWFRSAAALALLLLGITAYKVRTAAIRKQERQRAAIALQTANLRLDALRARMNPHFIFNCLNSIQYFIATHEAKPAITYLSKFARLMRQTLDNSGSSLVRLADEMEMLTHYADLERLRLENRFDYWIEAAPEVAVENLWIPSLLIQPYVENAIVHGLRHKSAQGKLLIQFEQQEQQLHCIIQDNGIGRQQAGQMRSSAHKSVATELTQNRLALLQQTEPYRQARVVTTDLQSDDGTPAGTRVDVWVPVQTEPG